MLLGQQCLPCFRAVAFCRGGWRGKTAAWFLSVAVDLMRYRGRLGCKTVGSILPVSLDSMLVGVAEFDGVAAKGLMGGCRV